MYKILDSTLNLAPYNILLGPNQTSSPNSSVVDRFIPLDCINIINEHLLELEETDHLNLRGIPCSGIV